MAASKRIRYAVVGLGGIAQRAVLPAFTASRKARLVALVSRDGGKAKRFARQFGASAYYTDYASCLANPDVDAVYLASPNGSHLQQTLMAAAAGKHVLCEKPMANTVEDCRSMIAACERHGVRLMVAYRKYFEPGSLALRKLLASGSLGAARIIHSAFTIMIPPGKGQKWRFDPALAGGGVLPDVGIYCINTVRWLTGLEPFEADAYSWNTDAKRFNDVIEQHIAFRLIFPGGMVLQAAASFGAAQASFLRVLGERGWAALDPAYPWNEPRRLFGYAGKRSGWFEKKFPVMDEFALELDAFADCILKRREPEPNGTEGMRDVAVLEAIYQSARERRPVPVTIPE